MTNWTRWAQKVKTAYTKSLASIDSSGILEIDNIASWILWASFFELPRCAPKNNSKTSTKLKYLKEISKFLHKRTHTCSRSSEAFHYPLAWSQNVQKYAHTFRTAHNIKDRHSNQKYRIYRKSIFCATACSYLHNRQLVITYLDIRSLFNSDIWIVEKW